MSRLSKLFRPSRPAARKTRLGVEALDGRLLPSVVFSENPGNHAVSVVAGDHQDNIIVVFNDGNGNLDIAADGAVRHFTAVESLFVESKDGRDVVTYNQGTFDHAANTRRSFDLKVVLGYPLDSNDADKFTANVFGNVGFVQGGAVHARELGFEVSGGADADRIDFNLHDTDVIGQGSALKIDINGFGGNDNITVDMDGEVDGTLFLNVHGGDAILGGFDKDIVHVNVHLDSGSTGAVKGDGPTGAAIVTGDLGDDDLRFAVSQAAGSHTTVNALLDGGFNLFDHDVGRHTANVRVANLEQDLVVN
jgi:hypothetical protein